MSQTFTLSGRIRSAVDASSTDASFNPTLYAELYEQMAILQPFETGYDLTADGAQAVGFGGLASAAVVIIKPSGKVTVTLTNADNIAQKITTDQFMMIMCSGTPYTAISLQRAAGIATNVRIALAQLGT